MTGFEEESDAPAAEMQENGGQAEAPRVSIFDEDALVERLGGNVEFLREVIGLFLTDAPALTAAAREALDRQDFRQVQRRIHSLKGAAATISAEALRSAAARLEQVSKQESQGEARHCLDEVEHQLRLLAQQLARFNP